MKLGVCAGIADIGTAAAGGCDYLELGFASAADMSEEDFRHTLALAEKASIGVEAMNGFIPGRYRITGPQADLSPILPFMEGGFRRARALGVEVVVFGSGGARNMPEGFSDKRAAAEQCAEFLRAAGPLAAENGIRIAIEPLCYKEANLINTVAEATELARMVNLPSVGVLADYYHVLYNKEGLGGIAQAGGLLWHCHIARGGTRTLPLPGDGEDYASFFEALKAVGYEGRVSIEGRIDNLEEQIGPSIALMRELL